MKIRKIQENSGKSSKSQNLDIFQRWPGTGPARGTESELDTAGPALATKSELDATGPANILPVPEVARHWYRHANRNHSNLRWKSRLPGRYGQNRRWPGRSPRAGNLPVRRDHRWAPDRSGSLRWPPCGRPWLKSMYMLASSCVRGVCRSGHEEPIPHLFTREMYFE